MTRRPRTPPEEPSSGSSPDTIQQLGRYGGHGLTLGAATALFAWLGSLLDGWLGTAPLFVVLGAVAGFTGGFTSMYRDLVLRSGRGDGGTAEEGERGPVGEGR